MCCSSAASPFSFSCSAYTLPNRLRINSLSSPRLPSLPLYISLNIRAALAASYSFLFHPVESSVSHVLRGRQDGCAACLPLGRRRPPSQISFRPPYSVSFCPSITIDGDGVVVNGGIGVRWVFSLNQGKPIGRLSISLIEMYCSSAYTMRLCSV